MKRTVSYLVLAILLCFGSIGLGAGFVLNHSGEGTYIYDALNVIGNVAGGTTVQTNGYQRFYRFFEFGSAANMDPWNNANFGTGAVTATVVTPASGAAVNHPGVVQFNCGTAANSGSAQITNAASYLLGGGESSNFIFYVNSTSGTSIRFGWQDSNTNTAPGNGLWIDISATTLAGKMAAGSTTSTTGSSYSISATTWYRVNISVNAAATTMTFTLYACSNGALLWQDSLTVNGSTIVAPTASGQECRHGLVEYNSGTGASAVVQVDFMDILINRVLTR